MTPLPLRASSESLGRAVTDAADEVGQSAPGGPGLTPCVHDWRYFEDPEHTYTGYLERCSKCGEIVQIIQ